MTDISAPVTVLFAAGSPVCSKSFTRIGDRIIKCGYPDDLYLYGAQQIMAGSISDLGAIVQTMSTVQNAMIVRAGLSQAARDRLDDGGAITRSKNDPAPFLTEIPLPWGMIDSDNFLMRPGDDLARDPVAAVEHAVHTMLPPAFHNVTALWQLSASAGFSRYLKAHIWYWFDRPIDNVTLRRRLNPFVDTAPYSATQPHYIVPPQITGMRDPIPVRIGWLLGSNDAVAIDAVPEPEVGYLIPSFGGVASGDAVADLMAIIQTIGDGANRFHVPLRDATSQYSRAVAGRQLARDDDAFKEFLRRCIDDAPKDHGRDVSRYHSDAYLDDLIGSALGKRARAAAAHPYQRMLRKLTAI